MEPLIAMIAGSLGQFDAPGSSFLDILVPVIVIAGLLVIAAGAGYLLYFLYSLPMRRHERCRFLLNLIESGLERGVSPEHVVQGVFRSGARQLGKPFRRLAARIDQGESFRTALDHTPSLLPPQIREMLKVGYEMGDLAKVLPACRVVLKDAVSKVWTAQNYLMVLAFVVSPVWTAIFLLLTAAVFPKFEMILADMGADPPAILTFFSQQSRLMLAIQVSLMVFFYAGAFLYIGGPKTSAWVARSVPAAFHKLQLVVPWRWKRLQRDFSSILATLLDSGVPEPRALALAAESTANPMFRERAAAVAADLSRGVTLVEAVTRLDAQGEFRWRLANAAKAGRGFMDALVGWHDALEAKAFQQEQTAAQVITTALVLVNGVFVGLLATSVFTMFVSLIEAAPLW